jgi:hypothetical protein
MPDMPETDILPACRSFGHAALSDPAYCAVEGPSLSGLRTDRQGVLQPAPEDASRTLRELSDRFSGEQARSCRNTPHSPQRYLQVNGIAVDRAEMAAIRELFFSGGPLGNTLGMVVYCSNAAVAGTPGFNVSEPGDLRRAILRLGGLDADDARPFFEIGLGRMIRHCGAGVLQGDDAESRCRTLLMRLLQEARRLDPANRQNDLEPPVSCGGSMHVIPGTTFAERDLELLRERLRLGPAELMFNRNAAVPGQACIAGHGPAHLEWMIRQLDPCPVERGLCDAVGATLREAMPERRSLWFELGVIIFVGFGILAPLGHMIVSRIERRLALETPAAGPRPGDSPDRRNGGNGDEPPPAGSRSAAAQEGVDAAADPVEAEPVSEGDGSRLRQNYLVEPVGGSDGAGVRIVNLGGAPSQAQPSPAAPRTAAPPRMPDYGSLETDAFAFLAAGIAAFFLARRLGSSPSSGGTSLLRPLAAGI